MTIIDQQLALHFGDNFPDVATQATRFCRNLVSKKWWGQNRNMLLNNEGGIPGMRVQALISIIEVEDITEGLKTYGRYLRKTYAPDYTTESIDFYENENVTTVSPFPFRDGATVEESLVTDSDLQSLYEPVEEMALSPSETEFFQTYASVKDVQETCALLGLSYSDGHRLYDRVKTRAKYKIQAGIISL